MTRSKSSTLVAAAILLASCTDEALKPTAPSPTTDASSTTRSGAVKPISDSLRSWCWNNLSLPARTDFVAPLQGPASGADKFLHTTTEIFDKNGFLFRRLSADVPRSDVVVPTKFYSIPWDFEDSTGRAAPGGEYFLYFKALDRNGAVVRQDSACDAIDVLPIATTPGKHLSPNQPVISGSY